MATYFHANSEIQAACGGGDGGGGGGVSAGSGEVLQTLILMNPTGHGYNVGYSDSPQPPGNNFFFLNSNPPGGGNGGNQFNAPLSSQPQQLLGIPLASPTNQSSSATSSQQDISLFQYANFLPRSQYNYNQKPMDHVEAARDTPRAQRGLSLSLSSQIPAYGVNNGMHNHVSLSPKYLKAAQELLDEVVNVGNPGFNKAVFDDGHAGKSDQQPSSTPETVTGEVGSGWPDKGGKRGGEMTTAEKQEIQMKKAKLMYMLDEVEQRYRQYHQQMQLVASTFEQAGGIGSAKPYTALALKTISKQFRSIKDAILSQVKAASKSLGEEDDHEEQEDDGLMGGGNNNNNNNIKKGLLSSSSSSRMKYVDNQLRQQRALQQLGMVHHNAWRPQRGLPERSVSVLRSWLFEHFLHPYPKDSDKIMLAKQAGLTRGQVSNWFINARVRLWKPMVEEMHSEEMKEQEKNASEENSVKNEQTAFKNPKETSTMENPNKSYDVLNQTGDFCLIGSPEMGSISNENPKKQGSSDVFPSISMDTIKPDESDNEHLPMKFDTDKRGREDGFSLLGGPTNFINGGGFSAYPFAELGRLSADHQFSSPYSSNNNNNGVCLSLGLPRCENIAMSGPHQTFLSNQNQSMESVREVEIGDARDYRTITTFGNTRGLMQNYYQAL